MRDRAQVVVAILGAVVALVAGPAGAVASATTPAPVPDRYVIASGGVLAADVQAGVLANDGGPGVGAAELRRSPANGAVVLAADGSFTYRARAGFEGTDAFRYRIVGPGGASTDAVAELVVNRAPRAADDRFQIAIDGGIRRAAPGLLANDVDLVGGALRAHLVQQAAHGRAWVAADGSFVYRPEPGFQGTDRFRYVARDELEAWSRAATVTIRVGANRAPVAVTETYTVDEDNILEVAGPGVLGNDTDADGDGLVAELVGFPSSGLVDLRPDGSFAFEGGVDADGDVTFRYRAFDGAAWSEPVTVLIDVIAVNDPPVAENDQYVAFVGFPLEVAAPGVLGNDSDPVEFDGLFALVERGPTSGQLTLRRDGSFTYLADPGPTRADGFTYLACDVGSCTSASVDLEVIGDEVVDEEG
jgi:hypothetical protein